MITTGSYSHSSVNDPIGFHREFVEAVSLLQYDATCYYVVRDQSHTQRLDSPISTTAKQLAYTDEQGLVKFHSPMFPHQCLCLVGDSNVYPEVHNLSMAWGR